MILVSYIVSGLLIGLLVGITGVGGGALMTPLLVLLFGFSAPTAVGTDLMFAAVTKCIGVAVHHRNHRSVDWAIVKRLSMGAIPGALVALVGLKGLSAKGHDEGPVVVLALGSALILTALALMIRSLLQRRLEIASEREEVQPAHVVGGLRAWMTVGVGFAIGVLVTLSSIGAGALGATALVLLYPRLPTLTVVGTDLAYAIPLTVVAGVGHWYLGNVDPMLLMSLLVGSIPGIWLGSHWSVHIPERIMQRVLAVVLLATGIKFVFAS